MKTVYANSSRPGLIKWSCTAAFIIGIGLFVLYIILEEDYRILLYIASFGLIYGGMFYGIYKLKTYEIDDVEGTITDYKAKKYPLKIADLSTATYKESKKRKYRSLFLHDTGTGFMDIRTSKENADKIVAQLLQLNPSIEIKHANLI